MFSDLQETRLRLGSGSASITGLVPPPSFYLPQEPISHVWSTDDPFAGRRSRNSAAQRAGLAYQRKVGRYLESSRKDWILLVGPWLAYSDLGSRRRFCQPDFILDCGGGLAVVVEVKLRWTPLAWWQLKKLYLPVLSATKKWQTIIPLCISRSFDPAEPAPEVPYFCDDIFDARPDSFNLLVVR